MPKFELTADYSPTGDQPEAIAQLTEGVLQGVPAQTLLGVTGSDVTGVTVAEFVTAAVRDEGMAATIVRADVAAPAPEAASVEVWTLSLPHRLEVGFTPSPPAGVK